MRLSRVAVERGRDRFSKYAEVLFRHLGARYQVYYFQSVEVQRELVAQYFLCCLEAHRELFAGRYRAIFHVEQQGTRRAVVSAHQAVRNGTAVQVTDFDRYEIVAN